MASRTRTTGLHPETIARLTRRPPTGAASGGIFAVLDGDPLRPVAGRRVEIIIEQADGARTRAVGVLDVVSSVDDGPQRLLVTDATVSVVG